MGDEIEWIPKADPDRDWRKGLAYLVRIRTLIVAGISNTVGFGFIWNKIDIYRAVPVFVAGLAVIGSLVVVRLALRRTCSTGTRFHDICHEIRDKCEELRQTPHDGIYAERLDKIHGHICENIAEFFRTMLWDPGLQCAIRLATKMSVGGQPASDYYITVGRSVHTSHARVRLSAPVPANKGVPELLRSNGSLGTVLVSDVKKAKKNGHWFPTPTDELDDVRVLAIAPINSYENGQKSMYGMLCITSKKRRMSQMAVEPLKGFADMLGFVYARVRDDRVIRAMSTSQGKDTSHG